APHGVRRTGSHDDRPVTIVVGLASAGLERSTRCTAGTLVSSSQTNRNRGLSSSGHIAIWSAAEATLLDTSEARRPGASWIAWRVAAPSYGPSALGSSRQSKANSS